MQQQLGLVCLTSPTCATRISYRTLRKASVTPHALASVYRDNARTLRAAVVYCKTVLRTRLYRMPSALLPWLDSDDPAIVLSLIHI
jgi:UV DNA damage repair endonuclease